MDQKASYLILLVCAPGFIFLTHLTAFRLLRFWNREVTPLFVTAFVVAVWFFITVVWSWWVYLRFLPVGVDWMCAVLYGIAVYGGLSFSYFILFAMTESARRIHILRKLYEAGAQPVSDLMRDYSTTNMLTVRLNRMVEL